MLDNFGKFGHIKVSLDPSVTYLTGPNGSGKTSIGLNAIWFAMKGIAQKGNDVLLGERFRFIGEEKPKAVSTIVIYDEKLGTDIVVRRSLTKSGHKVEFQAKEGVNLDQKWLDDIFNVFLIAPQRFIDLNPKDQALALGIDVTKFDERLTDLKEEYTEINRRFRAMGEIEDLQPVTRVDVTKLNEERVRIREIQISKEAKEKSLGSVQANIISGRETVTRLKQELKRAEESLANNETEQRTLIAELEAIPTDLDEKLEEIKTSVTHADQINKQADAYEKSIQEKKEKDDILKELMDNKEAQSKVEKEKQDFIQAFDFPFRNLSVDEDGGLLLDEKPIKEPYFSSGELLKIVPIMMAATSKSPLKYVFIQHFNLLDLSHQASVIKALTDKGFQVVLEVVDESQRPSDNVIVLRDLELVVDGESEPEDDKEAIDV